MADRLTAEQLATYTGRNIRVPVVRTLVLDNDAISATDITEYVRDWGDLKTSVFNRHPRDPGTLDFPVVTLEVDNHNRRFSRGGVYFPNGSSDFTTATATLTITVGGTTFLSFVARVKESEYGDSKHLRLILEHPLAVLTQRKWTKEDRYGGDTTAGFNFGT